jgi:hypothetical protein
MKKFDTAEDGRRECLDQETERGKEERGLEN